MYTMQHQNKSRQHISQNASLHAFSQDSPVPCNQVRNNMVIPLSLRSKTQNTNDIANYNIQDIRISYHTDKPFHSQTLQTQYNKTAPFLYPFPKEKRTFLPKSFPVIQGKLYINDCNIEISPYSRNMRYFFNNYVIPFLNRNNYRSYGILSQFRNYLYEDNEFDTIDDFLNHFHRYLQQQVRNVRGGHTVPVLREFSISTMSRPAWPQNFRQRLMAIAQVTDDAFNIRHVIRNRTLLAALQIYEETMGRHNMLRLAKLLGIDSTDGSAYDACVRALYRILYLNISNLWMGSGIVNQIIGFLATPIQAYGQNILLGIEEFTDKRLYEIIITHTSIVRGSAKRKTALINELYSIILNCISAAENSDDIGAILEDIGLNLGFDMIDDQSDKIAQRQELLFYTEARLQRYISSGGQSENLLDIFNTFLNIPFNASASDDTTIADDKTEHNLALANNEANLALQNNCLIHAIAAIADRPLSPEIEIGIRTNLNDANIAPLGEMLDGDDPLTVTIIMTALNIDPSQVTLEIYDTNNQLLARHGIGRIPLKIYYNGNHFFI